MTPARSSSRSRGEAVSGPPMVPLSRRSWRPTAWWCRPTGWPRRPASSCSGEAVGGRRGHRGQRRARRHRPAPLRDGRRPLRRSSTPARARPWSSTPPAGPVGRRPRPGCGRRVIASMPFRGDPALDHRAGLRRRMAGAARPASVGCRSPRCSRRRPSTPPTASRPPRCSWRRRRACPRRRRRAPGLHGLGGQASGCGGPARRRALSAIASDGRQGFYGGEFGTGLLGVGQGEYDAADLARPLASWVEPIGLHLWDHEVWTVPPPSQGYLTLASAWVAERMAGSNEPDDGRWASTLAAAAIATGRDRPALLCAGLPAAPTSSTPAPGEARLDDASSGAGRSRVSDRRRAADAPHVAPSIGDGTGRVAHPVERLGVRESRLRAVHGDQPPQPGHRLLAGAGPPGRVRAWPSPSPHALPRARHPPGRAPCS